jgi:Asp-tRNA(Asn)/Glu-tRNA(Gln) amidotransferase B subunit
MWAHPPSQFILIGEGWKAAATSCFKAEGALPLYQKWRFRDEYGLPPEDIDWWFIPERNDEGHFISYPMFDILFERSLWIRCFPTLTSKIIVQLLTSKFATREEMFNFFCEGFNLEEFSEFVRECGQYEYPWKYIQSTVEKYFADKLTWIELTTIYPYVVNSNQSELEALCDTILKENQKSIDDYKKGKTNSINHLKGVAMKMTKGKADIRIVTEILEKKLKA